MTERNATTDRSSDPGFSMWHTVIAMAMLPFTLLLLLLLSVIAVASLPATYAFYRVVEPRRTRRSMASVGRWMEESECLARLRHGEGSLIIHRREGGWLSGIQDQAWYTDDVIDAPSAPEAAPDLDTLTDEQARELGANIVLWNRLYRRYARTNWGDSKLVYTAAASAFARRVRAECPAARVIEIVRWQHLFPPSEACRACKHPMRDFDRLRCPKCGERTALPRPSRG